MADLEQYGFELDEEGWINVTEENAKLMIFPKQHVGSVKKILCVDEVDRWALAVIPWDGRFRLATRWFWSRIGDPNSRGYPTWHVLPDEFAKPLLTDLLNRSRIDEQDYRFCIDKIGRR